MLSLKEVSKRAKKEHVVELTTSDGDQVSVRLMTPRLGGISECGKILTELMELRNGSAGLEGGVSLDANVRYTVASIQACAVVDKKQPEMDEDEWLDVLSATGGVANNPLAVKAGELVMARLGARVEEGELGKVGVNDPVPFGLDEHGE